MLRTDDIAGALELYELGRNVSNQSLRSLDWLNFFKADAQTTVGPYLAIFLLAARHWNLAAIGIAMSVPGLVTVLAQTPAAALVDWIARTRALVTVAALGLAAGCLLLVTTVSLTAVILAQGVIAVVMILIPPAIAAISVGLVGHHRFAQRMGRNEAYSHGGAVAGALVVGAIGYWVTSTGIFYFAAVTSLAAAFAAMAIREEDIDPVLAREAEVESGGTIHILSIREMLRDSRLAIFTIAAILFHLANAAMLPLGGLLRSPTSWCIQPEIARANSQWLDATIAVSEKWATNGYSNIEE